MLCKNNGIVLHRFKFSDHALIVKILSDCSGIQSYILQGGHKTRSKAKAYLLQPMAVIEYVADTKPGRGIQRLKEIKLNQHFKAQKENTYTGAIKLFMAEVLYKSLRETGPDGRLFQFIISALKQLESNAALDFQLLFLVKLTRYLGFYPLLSDESNALFFNLYKGKFVPEAPEKEPYLNAEQSIKLKYLLGMNFDDFSGFKLDKKQRTEMLEKILEYYQIHIPSFHQIKSLSVLQAVFDS